MGAGRILAIDGVAARLELAKQFGADETINVVEIKESGDRVARVMELTRNRGADVVCELVGLAGVVPEGLQMVRAGGTYLEIGDISIGQTVAMDPSALVWGNKKIVGVGTYDPWVIPKALDFVERTRHKYPLGRIVSHKFPLEKINDAFKQAEWLNRQTDLAVTRAALTME